LLFQLINYTKQRLRQHDILVPLFWHSQFASCYQSAPGQISTGISALNVTVLSYVLVSEWVPGLLPVIWVLRSCCQLNTAIMAPNLVQFIPYTT